MILKSDNRKDLIKFSFINCICCGKPIQLKNFMGDNIKTEEDLENLVLEHKLKLEVKYNPESQMWDNGDVMALHCGYGSRFDGTMGYIGICDDCIEKHLKSTHIRYVGNYLDFKDYTLKELQVMENKRCRNINIDKILNDK